MAVFIFVIVVSGDLLGSFTDPEVHSTSHLAE